MSWHPLGPEPVPEKIIAHRERDEQRREQELAKLTPQEVMDLLSGDLTSEMIRARTLYAERLVRYKTLSTRELLQEFKNRFRGYGYGEEHDIIREILNTREHIPTAHDTKLLRRANALAHHGPRSRRKQANSAVKRIHSRSSKNQARLSKERAERDQEVMALAWVLSERCKRLGRTVDYWRLRDIAQEEINKNV